MESHKIFRIGLVLLALFVIIVGIWVFTTPPIGDEPQALALFAIGVFMILIGYQISRRPA